MFPLDQYELIDFGDGRKLERFGQFVVDRPSPSAATERPRRPNAWTQAHARFDRGERERGTWQFETRPPDDWALRHGRLRFRLKTTPFGHLGLFPEHATNWTWIGDCLQHPSEPWNVLNLFAYTGATSLLAADYGAQVVHVDAARNVVSWARENARLSRLEDAPIRWIVEDASKFVQREVRRGRSYDAVILDPPSYGHGPKSEVWRLDEHLPPLLRDCRILLERSVADSRSACMLLTCHTPGYGPSPLRRLLRDALDGLGGRVSAADLTLATRDNRRLSCGTLARWTSANESTPRDSTSRC